MEEEKTAIDMFLDSLDSTQIQDLRDIIENEIDGDIDYLLFKINEYDK